MKFQQPAYFFVPQNCNLQLMKDLQDTLAMWKDSVEQNSSEVRFFYSITLTFLAWMFFDCI